MKKYYYLSALQFCCIVLLTQVAPAQVTDTGAQWTWVSGESITLDRGAAPTQGVEAAGNRPSSRMGAVSWTDTAGNFWFFGGDYNGVNWLNDLWRYNVTTGMWMWVKGSFSPSSNDGFRRVGVYGTKGVAAPANTPGGHECAVSWKDKQGKFWFFGGWGYGESASEGFLNDMWKYDPATNNWTWMSGEKTINPSGNYGTKGVAASTNQPRARGYDWAGGAAAGWMDTAGNFWVFGGRGYNKANTAQGHLNDLWKYDLAAGMWTWVGGSDESNQTGNYGTKGTAATTNQPGSRYAPTYWTDNTGKFWLFGGYGYDKNGGTIVSLNDLWRYDPATGLWTWMHGSDVGNANGIYGVRGVANPANTPGGRRSMGTGEHWVDVNGRLWLYGGEGYARTGTAGQLSDLWMYDPATNQWTWMKGADNTSNTSPTRGTKGTPSPTNQPGTRLNSVRWKDPAGNFWLYGALVQEPGVVFKSDLWRLAPILPVTPPQPGLFTAAKPNVCVGESNVTYTIPSVTGATSYDWEYSGTNTTLTANTTTPTNSISFAANATGGTLRVRAVNAGGSSPWRDTIITVNALPTVSSTNTGNRSICSGDSLQLTASGSSGVSYQWKQGTTNVGTNNATYYAKTAGNYTVTVTNTTTNCSATSTPATVLQVNTLPTVTSTNTGARSICSGDSLLLTASGSSGVSYQWKQGTTNVGTNSATYYAKTPGNYTVTATNANNCSATSTPATVLTVNNLPTVTSTNTGARSICAGDSLLLTASGSSGVSYQWKEGTTNVGTGATYYAKTAGSYMVTATNANNCSATSTPATTLTVNALPVVSVTAGGPVELCTGGTVTLTATQLSGTDYQWKEGSTNIGTNTNTYAASATGSYKVVATTTATGCADSTQPLDVFVYNRPSVLLTPGDTAFCEGGLVTLEVESQDTGLTYVWKNGSTVIPLASAYFLEITETGDYTVEVGRASVAGCDTVTNEVTVTVHPLPVAEVTWDGEILHATPGYAGYQWNTGSQPVIGETDSTFRPSADGDYSVMVTDSNGCIQTSPVYNVKVGVNDIASLAKQIKIYPNPAQAEIYIEAPVAVDVYMTGPEGRILMKRENVAGRLDISALPVGLYLLRIADRDGMPLRTEKVLKTE